jgi:hypothetical protein
MLALHYATLPRCSFARPREPSSACRIAETFVGHGASGQASVCIERPGGVAGAGDMSSRRGLPVPAACSASATPLGVSIRRSTTSSGRQPRPPPRPVLELPFLPLSALRRKESGKFLNFPPAGTAAGHPTVHTCTRTVLSYAGVLSLVTRQPGPRQPRAASRFRQRLFVVPACVDQRSEQQRQLCRVRCGLLLQLGVPRDRLGAVDVDGHGRAIGFGGTAARDQVLRRVRVGGVRIHDRHGV